MKPPDFIIGGTDNPYLLRWWLIPRNRWFNIYLHKFLRSDDDRALHDHPWVNISIVLKGGYDEVVADFSREPTPYQRIADLPVIRKLRRPGSIVLRRPTSSHRLELLERNGRTIPCWSLFITGPRVREWGFHCPQGWKPWYAFVASTDSGSVGKGCEP